MRLSRNAVGRAEEEGYQPSPALPILKLSNFTISCLFLAYQIKKLLTTNTTVAGGVWQARKKSAEVENDLGVYRLIQRKLIIDTEIAGRVW